MMIGAKVWFFIIIIQCLILGSVRFFMHQSLHVRLETPKCIRPFTQVNTHGTPVHKCQVLCLPIPFR